MGSPNNIDVSRRLAAIVIADVVGYTRLMERDDIGTFARLRTIRDEIVDPAIVSHGGRIVKTAGDGLLAEFPSALSALRASVQIQREMVARMAGVAADERIDYRIGVNLGDIIIDGDDIAGDGVNVASRLESMAEPGGICASGAVREQVHGQLDVAFVDIGEQQVKNIARPIRVYRVAPGAGAEARGGPRVPVHAWAKRSRWIAAGVAALAVAGIGWRVLQQRGESAAPAAAPPMSVAIVPFSAPGGSSADQQFAEVLARNVATGLGRDHDLRVASYRAGTGARSEVADVRSIGRELDVRYVAEGEVRRVGARLTVNARLVDAGSAVQAWSERFEPPAAHAGDDEAAMSRRVTASLRSAIADAEDRRAAAYAGPARNGMELVARAHNAPSAEEAAKLIDEALQREPNLVPALNERAGYLWVELERDPRADRDRIVRTMDELSGRAVSIDYDHAQAWSTRAIALAFNGRLAQALAANERAWRLDPNVKDTIVLRAWLMILGGRPDEALALLDDARTLFPGEGALQVRLACIAYVHLGRYDDAIAQCERSAGISRWWADHSLLAAAYAQKGESEKAAAARAEMDRLVPGLTIAALRSRRYSEEPGYLERAERHVYAGLRKAGVPEQ